MSAKRSKSFKERLAAAKLAERSIQVCLRGDLAAEFEELERQLIAARQAERGDGLPRMMGDVPASVEIAEKQKKVSALMADEMLTIKFRALPRHQWQALAAKHPPRPDEDGDRALGINLEPFAAEVLPLSIVEPEMDAEDWTALNDVLSSGDFDRIFGAVWDVNRSGVDVPFSRLGSLVIAENAAGSK